MPVDRADEDDAVPDARGTALADRCAPAERARAETRDPVTYEAELRAAVAADRWEMAASRFAERWSAYERDHPPPADPDSPRSLDPATDAEVDRACDRIREVEQRVITPAMREIEAEDSDRALVGLDHRLKGEDRLKEKVANYLWTDPEATSAEAMSMIPDAVRFTFCYAQERYSASVHADVERLESRGFEIVRPLKNSWESDQYKGINTQWRDPESGVRFEVQFHTQISFEAKQLTHSVYERLRSRATPDGERQELQELQHQVCAKIPVPPGASEIEHYPRKGYDG